MQKLNIGRFSTHLLPLVLCSGLLCASPDLNMLQKDVSRDQQRIDLLKQEKCAITDTDDCRSLADLEVSLKETRGEVSDLSDPETPRDPGAVATAQMELSDLDRQLSTIEHE